MFLSGLANIFGTLRLSVAQQLCRVLLGDAWHWIGFSLSFELSPAELVLCTLPADVG